MQEYITSNMRLIDPNFGLGLLDTLPPDALGGIIGALDFGSLINFVATSKKLRQRLEEPDVSPSLAWHVPTIYRTQSRLVAMIEGVGRSMLSATLGYPMTPEYLIFTKNSQWSAGAQGPFQLHWLLWDRLERWSETLRVHDQTPDTNRMRRAMVIDCIAIEILVTDYRSFALDQPEVIGVHSGEIGRCEGISVSLIEQLLRFKDYFSPRLFRLLLQKDRLHLLHAFFARLGNGDREKNKELARFLLKNCDRFLLDVSEDGRAQLKDLLGAEFEELSTHMVFKPGRSALETLPSDAFGEIVGRLDLDVLIHFMVASKWLRQRLNGPYARPSLVRHLPTIYRTQPGIVERLVEVIEGVWQSMGNMVLGYHLMSPEAIGSLRKFALHQFSWPVKTPISDEVPPQRAPSVREPNPMYGIHRHPVGDSWDGLAYLPLKQVLRRTLEAWRSTSHSIPPTNNSTKPMLVPSIKGRRPTALDKRLLRMVIDCIAIEKLVTEHEPLLRAKSKNEEMMYRIYFRDNIASTLSLIEELLQFKDHFSPKLFSFLLRRDRDALLEVFILLFRRSGDQEKKELVRFLLKNCDGFLLGLDEDRCAEIENLLGDDEIKELSMHYRVFGSHRPVKHGMGGDASYPFQGLCAWVIGPTCTVSSCAEDEDVEERYEFVRHLVRVSKCVFTSEDRVKNCLLMVSREVCKQFLLEKRGGLEEPSTELRQEVTARFEKIIERIVTQVMVDDTTPFCAHPEFEQNSEFVYGFESYLIRECTVTW